MNHRGNSMIEFLIIFPLFLLLLFGLMEFSLIYRAKFTLNHAAQQVARAGSINNACMGAMDDQLIRSLSPLFLKRNPDLKSYLLTQAKKKNAIKFYSDVDVVFPDMAVFNAFKKKIILYPSQISDCAAKFYNAKPFRPSEIIPLDNLQHRSVQTKLVNSNGNKRHINIQDANLLKIQIRYCHRLYFPIIDLILDSMQTSKLTSTTDTIFYNNCINGKGTDFALSKNARYVVLSAHAIARMQTPIFKQSLKEK